MKILYVEDDFSLLSVVIPEIFWSFMTEEEKTKFNAIRKDVYDGCQAVKDLFSNNPFINVEFDFLSALKRIESQDMEQYDYFILDRNLDAKGISIEDVKQVFPKFTKSEFNYIWNNNEYGREGDFLLKRLYSKLREKISRKVYFLSAYPSEDVFQNDDFLRDIVEDGKILTRENYIAKDDNKMINESGKQRLRDILESDDEEFQLYKKWGKVLSYYDNFWGGHEVRRRVISALKMSSSISSKEISSQDPKKMYYDILEALDIFYEDYFEDRVRKQLSALKQAEDAERKINPNFNLKQFQNQWYSSAPIPRNIIEISNTMPQSRNNCRHIKDQGYNVDVSGLTVLASAYALLEVTRFWQDNKWFDKIDRSSTINL